MLADQVASLWQAYLHPEQDQRPLQRDGYSPPEKPLLYVDATLGEAGHARLLLGQQPQVNLLGIDADPQMLKRARYFLQQALGPQELVQRCHLVPQRFSDYFHALEPGKLQANLILFDLGISLFHYSAGRGFSFCPEDPNEILDMRLNPEDDRPSAAELLQNLGEAELADIFWYYGELRNSRQIARAIVQQRSWRELHKAQVLADFIRQLPQKKVHSKIHPATRIFQALRIAVGDELGQLERSLPAALEQLQPYGLLAVITFHSLEDRLVKQLFRTWQERGQAQWVYKKAIQAPYDSPLASERSAKLRVVRRMNV